MQPTCKNFIKVCYLKIDNSKNILMIVSIHQNINIFIITFNKDCFVQYLAIHRAIPSFKIIILINSNKYKQAIKTVI